jgi:hypothetical protein
MVQDSPAGDQGAGQGVHGRDWALPCASVDASSGVIGIRREVGAPVVDMKLEVVVIPVSDVGGTGPGGSGGRAAPHAGMSPLCEEEAGRA